MPMTPRDVSLRAQSIGLSRNAFHFSLVEYETQGVALVKWRKNRRPAVKKQQSRSSIATALPISDCYKMDTLAPETVLEGNLLGGAALARHYRANTRKRKRCRDHKADRAGIRRCGKLLDLA